MTHAVKREITLPREVRRVANVFELNRISPEQLSGSPSTADLIALFRGAPALATPAIPVPDAEAEAADLAAYGARLEAAEDPDAVSRHLADLIRHVESLERDQAPSPTWQMTWGSAVPPLGIAATLGGTTIALQEVAHALSLPALISLAPWLGLLVSVPIGLTLSSLVLGLRGRAIGPVLPGDRLRIAGVLATVRKVGRLGLRLDIEGEGSRSVSYAFVSYCAVTRAEDDNVQL